MIITVRSGSEFLFSFFQWQCNDFRSLWLWYFQQTLGWRENTNDIACFVFKHLRIVFLLALRLAGILLRYTTCYCLLYLLLWTISIVFFVFQTCLAFGIIHLNSYVHKQTKCQLCPLILSRNNQPRSIIKAVPAAWSPFLLCLSDSRLCHWRTNFCDQRADSHVRPVDCKYLWHSNLSNQLTTVHNVALKTGQHGHVCRDSSVGIATRSGPDGPRIKSRWRRDFPHPSRPALGPTQPPAEWVPGVALNTHLYLALRLKKE